MALIHCRECGEKISEKAPSCPNCGDAVSKEEEEKSWFGEHPVLTLFLVIFCVALIGSQLEKGKKGKRGKNNNSPSKGSSATANNTTSTTEGNKKREPKMGETVKCGWWEYTILDHRKSKNFHGKTTSGYFHIIKIRAKNVSDGEATLSANLFEIEDAQERYHRYSSEAMTAQIMSGGEGVMLKGINPGMEKTVTIVFELAEDIEAKKVKCDGGFTSSEKTWIRLEQ